MIKQTDLACISIVMVASISANGRMICRMGLATKPGTIILDIKECTAMAESMDLVFTLGRMAQNIRVSGTRINCRALDSTSGSMAEAIKGSGTRAIWMGSEHIRGRMVESTKASTLTIRSTATEFSNGTMAGSTQATGPMVTSMASAFTPSHPRTKPNTVSGRTVS